MDQKDWLDSGEVDDSDADPDWICSDEKPRKRRKNQENVRACKARRSLFSDGCISPRKYSKQKRSNLIDLESLKSLLKDYEEQLVTAKMNGNKSAVKRKAKRVAQFKSLINDLQLGKNINLENLPDPSKSPLSKNYKGKVSTNQDKDDLIEETVLKESDLIMEGIDPIIYDINCNGPAPENANLKQKGLKGRKSNFCIVCHKKIKEFCKHFETVHKETPEGKQLLELNHISDKLARKKLKTEITNVLRKKGNAEYNKTMSLKMLLEGESIEVIPVKRFTKNMSNENNTVQCTHCLGYYSRRKLSQHVPKCEQFKRKNTSENDVTSGTENNSELPQKPMGCLALKNHSLPVIREIPEASDELVSEVISTMKPRATKDVAIRDPLIMKYASEFHKSRRESFQTSYISRVISDLSRLLMRLREIDSSISCLQDSFSPIHFSLLVKTVLEEAGYDPYIGKVKKCGVGNRLRSHIKGAALTAKECALSEEYASENNENSKSRRKRVKHFLEMLEDKWANEVGRIFDHAVKESRSEKEPKLAAEADIVTVCQYVKSQYSTIIQKLDSASGNKENLYNNLLDMLVTHIMCLIRRRPVDFKRAQNVHYDRLEKQEDLVSEIKHSKHMSLTEEDLQLCNQFKIFFVPGKGWKEMVPIALTNMMKDALDAIQRNKKFVGIKSATLFVRANEMPINPRECLRKVSKNVTLKKPLDLSGNGLRHHAGTFSKLHSNHPNYQDYLASALGHTLHIHKLHYEMPTNLLQKLIVVPVLNKMTEPVEKGKEAIDSSTTDDYQDVEEEICPTRDQDIGEFCPMKDCQQVEETCPTAIHKDIENCTRNNDENTSSAEDEQDTSSEEDEQEFHKKKSERQRWSNEEKQIMYEIFGEDILKKRLPPRKLVTKLRDDQQHIFKNRTVNSMVSFLQSRCNRTIKVVTPEVKRYINNTHRRLTNIPI